MAAIAASNPALVRRSFSIVRRMTSQSFAIPGRPRTDSSSQQNSTSLLVYTRGPAATNPSSGTTGGGAPLAEDFMGVLAPFQAVISL